MISTETRWTSTETRYMMKVWNSIWRSQWDKTW